MAAWALLRVFPTGDGMKTTPSTSSAFFTFGSAL
jgi:hypothetical protein